MAYDKAMREALRQAEQTHCRILETWEPAFKGDLPPDLRKKWKTARLNDNKRKDKKCKLPK